jgi:hypothetical protein
MMPLSYFVFNVCLLCGVPCCALFQVSSIRSKKYVQTTRYVQSVQYPVQESAVLYVKHIAISAVAIIYIV